MKQNVAIRLRSKNVLPWSGAFMKCRQYLAFKRFTIVSDHVTLKCLLSLRLPTGRLARWSLLLQEYDFDVIHRPGVFHRVPDALSRLETGECDDTRSDPEVFTKCFFGFADNYQDEFDKFRLEQAQDPWIQHSFKNELLSQAANGLVYRPHTLGNLQLVVPGALHHVVMESHHDPPSVFHPGVTRMYFTTSRWYYCQTMGLDIAHYVASCMSCRRIRDKRPRIQAEMVIRTSYAPFELISMDILGP